MTRHLRLLAAFAILAACADSTSPAGAGGSGLKVGQPTAITLDPADSNQTLFFHGITDSVYSVEVEPASGLAFVSVLDSINQLQNGFVVAGTSTPPGERWVQTFAGPASNPWVIRVQSGTPGQGVAATITVHQVNTAPEHIGPAIAFNTVTDGESLDGYDDVDRFTFSGTAGQKVEIFVQGTAPADPSQQVCMVLDTLVPRAVALAVSTAGDTILEGSGPVQLPRTGPYRIDVTSSRNGCRDGFGANEPYLGAYRILVQLDTVP